MESREEKFKKYREEIANDTLKEEVFSTKEEVSDLEPEEDIKNTLTMKIDRIIEAHDEYTMIIEQKELEKKLKLQKKEKNIAQLKKISKIIAFVAIALVLVFVIVVFLMKVVFKEA